MSEFTQYTDKQVREVCENLLKDSFLNIKFDDNPLSVTLEFVSNVESKLVKFKCEKISRIEIEKNGEENAYYTVLEVSASHEGGVWRLNILPEIEVKLECKDLIVEVRVLSNQDLYNMGFRN